MSEKYQKCMKSFLQKELQKYQSGNIKYSSKFNIPTLISNLEKLGHNEYKFCDGRKHKIGSLLEECKKRNIPLKGNEKKKDLQKKLMEKLSGKKSKEKKVNPKKIRKLFYENALKLFKSELKKENLTATEDDRVIFVNLLNLYGEKFPREVIIKIMIEKLHQVKNDLYNLYKNLDDIIKEKGVYNLKSKSLDELKQLYVNHGGTIKFIPEERKWKISSYKGFTYTFDKKDLKEGLLLPDGVKYLLLKKNLNDLGKLHNDKVIINFNKFILELQEDYPNFYKKSYINIIFSLKDFYSYIVSNGNFVREKYPKYFKILKKLYEISRHRERNEPEFFEYDEDEEEFWDMIDKINKIFRII